MVSQLVIKILLSVVLLAMLVVLLGRRSGARHLAIRRLTYLVLLVAAIFSVIFPSWLTWLAGIVGVGRGTDLLLYGLVVVFISHSMASKSRHAVSDRRVTELARCIAIDKAEPAEEAGRRLSQNS